MPPAGSIHAERIRGGIVLLPPLTGAVSELRQQSGCSLSLIRNRQKQPKSWAALVHFCL